MLSESDLLPIQSAHLDIPLIDLFVIMIRFFLTYIVSMSFTAWTNKSAFVFIICEHYFCFLLVLLVIGFKKVDFLESQTTQLIFVILFYFLMLLLLCFQFLFFFHILSSNWFFFFTYLGFVSLFFLSLILYNLAVFFCQSILNNLILLNDLSYQLKI